ncbi:hypothetical protein HDU96_008028 [Phlyctochytrium bullatum]|nr:hypothetical protein HDU96_008028 [Phlyctochytrium bullatum]
MTVISALRTLQEKVERLESEKHNARVKISELEQDLRNTRQMLASEQTRAVELQTSPGLAPQVASRQPPLIQIPYREPSPVLYEAPNSPFMDLQRRLLEVQIEKLEAELESTRFTMKQAQRAKETGQEAHELAADLVNEAEYKARKAQSMLAMKEKQLEDELEAIRDQLSAEVAVRENEVWSDAYEKAMADFQARRPNVVEEGVQVNAMHETRSINTQFPSYSEIPADYREIISKGTQYPSQNNLLQPYPRNVPMRDEVLQTEAGDPLPSVRENHLPSESGMQLLQDYSKTQFVIRGMQHLRLREGYLGKRAEDLESQLERSQGLHQNAVMERDLARQELIKLDGHDLHDRRRREDLRPDIHHRVEWVIQRKIASRGFEQEDTGADADGEGHGPESLATTQVDAGNEADRDDESSVGFLSEKGIEQIRHEIHQAKLAARNSALNIAQLA